ncbi:hypothetical protein [Dactylosporangium sp. CA-092794]|uniref:hypothetical protein n=1 Tax=Dactylosporangium sp. CA-092794 TaxID=3239929 RepID=UPI003D916865
MIVGSLLLIVVAVGLLVLGLLQGSDALLVASIGASLLAAVALIVGGRQAAAARTSSRARTGRQVPVERYDPLASHLGVEDLDLGGSGEFARPAERQAVGAGARAGTTYGTATGTRSAARAEPADETAMIAPVRDEPEPPVTVSQRETEDRRHYEEYPADYADDDDDDEYDDEEPADEPPIQHSSAADLARIATLDTEVLVIDGRPRYHVPSCPHLLGRESEGLPAHEAVELGFTPCSACNPNDVLLAARR